MNNPYLEEFIDCDGSNYGSSDRHRLTKQYAWAVPDERAVRLIASLGPIVEIGAGNGYWASLIVSAGGDILAFDENPYDNRWCNGSYHPVVVGGPEVASNHPGRALFLCWPPYDTDFADECLRHYVEAGGQTLIYIGEGSGGCTGDDAFHERIEELCVRDGWDRIKLCVRDGWDRIDCVQLPQWAGIHDYLVVYRKR